MTKYLLIASTTIALCCSRSGLTQTAPTKSSNKVHAGQEVFTQKCFQCHSVAEGQVRFGPSLYHVTHSKTPTEIRVIISNGKGKMPPFKESLTKENVDALIAYVRSL
jgi:mono/diheme cytochrome c family protein